MLPLDQVIQTHQLAARPTRPTNFTIENQSLLALARTMAESPEAVLQQLVDEVARQCDADSAGISLLEPENDWFRWRATTGALGPFVGNTMPRNFSPCGTVLDKNQTLLMVNPVQHFEYINRLPVPVCEVLLVPFYQNGQPIGTLWIVSHREERRFDSEDARLVTNLSQFAAAAFQVIDAAKVQAEMHEHALKLAEDRITLVTEQHRLVSESEQGKLQFLATLAHELRNSLAPMSNAVQIVKLATDSVMKAKAGSIIEQQLSQLVGLVDDLLDIARVTNDKMRLKLIEIPLDQLVSRAVEAHREQVESSGQTVTFTASGTELVICGDEVRINQVLSNLLTNAIKYGVAGGVIEVSLYRDESYAAISVKDQGVGIESSRLRRIFDLFVQVNHSLEQSHAGLGIGLAVVKRLVEMHDGTISVQSAGLGQGSEFTVRLPLSQKESG